jgi:microcystin-dependent protein
MRTIATVILALVAFGVCAPVRTASAQVECFLGEIRWVGFNFAPVGWAIAAGQILPISQNTALFSLLGTTYGGNGQTTFALPDLRGRVPVGFGQGPGLSNYVLGETGGAEAVTLTPAQMPAHTHAAMAATPGATARDPGGNVQARTSEIGKPYRAGPATVAMDPSAIGTAGGGQPFENRPPYLTLTPIICLQGIFPSRP